MKSWRFVDTEQSLVPFSSPTCAFRQAMLASRVDMKTLRALLHKERSMNHVYDHVWKIAARSYKKPYGGSNVPDECYIAIMAYTLGMIPNLPVQLYKDFNDRCRKLCSVQSWQQFPYKSLYCLLIRAVPGVYNNPPVHKRLFRGVNLHFAKHVYKKGNIVCFNQFTSSTPVLHHAKGFATGVGTIIEFPHGAGAAMGISGYSAYPHELEVLIFPYSTFRIKEIQQYGAIHRIVLEVAGSHTNFGAIGLPIHPSTQAHHYKPKQPCHGHAGGVHGHCAKPNCHVHCAKPKCHVVCVKRCGANCVPMWTS